MKRFYRTRKPERIIGGVCGGIGKYFDIDPFLIRLILVALTLINGFTLIVYIVSWMLMPLECPEASEPEVVSES